jgi:hypothetical protein
VRGTPAVPPTGTGFAAVAEIARRRAQGWLTFGPMFSAPTPDWVVELRSGAVRQHLEVAVGWRTGEVADFGPSMLTLGVFDRAARRRTVEQDLESLTAAYATLADTDMLDAAHGACELLHQLSADESMAWSSGNLPRARELRVHQDRELRGDAGDRLQQASAAILGGTAGPPYLALAQLCELWVGMERAGSSFADGS